MAHFVPGLYDAYDLDIWILKKYRKLHLYNVQTENQSFKFISRNFVLIYKPW